MAAEGVASEASLCKHVFSRYVLKVSESRKKTLQSSILPKNQIQIFTLAQWQICIGYPLTSQSDPKGPGTSKLDWRYFEHYKVDRNELQVRIYLHKGTGTKMIQLFLSNCSIFQSFFVPVPLCRYMRTWSSFLPILLC